MISLNSFNQSAPWLVKLFPKKTMILPWSPTREDLIQFAKIKKQFEILKNTFDVLRQICCKFLWTVFNQNAPWLVKLFPKKTIDCPDYLQGRFFLRDIFVNFECNQTSVPSESSTFGQKKGMDLYLKQKGKIHHTGRSVGEI